MQHAEHREHRRKPEHRRIGQHTQQQRVANEGLDHVHDRLLVLEGDAEFAVQGIGEPADILLHQPVVQAEPDARGVNFLLRHGVQLIAVKRLQRIAGRETRQEEHDEREDKHDQDQQPDAADDPFG